MDVPVTYSLPSTFYKVFIDMKRHKNFNLLLMLVPLVAVGQMAQTIYIPAIADMAAVSQTCVKARYRARWLLICRDGRSLQFFYGPLSDRVGRRPRSSLGCLFYAGDADCHYHPYSAGVDRCQRTGGNGYRRRRRDGAYLCRVTV